MSNILRETIKAIWHALNKKYLIPPTETHGWIRIAEEFETEWNFPHCVGAIDGKHTNMECPENDGSVYFNYKSFHSIVLQAVCDAKYCFTFVDIGAYVGIDDSRVLSETLYGTAFDEAPTKWNLPSPAPVEGQNLTFVLLGDAIFPLKPWLMKPFPGKNLDEPQRVFNFRPSRTRRSIEDAFGILSAK